MYVNGQRLQMVQNARNYERTWELTSNYMKHGISFMVIVKKVFKDDSKAYRAANMKSINISNIFGTCKGKKWRETLTSIFYEKMKQSLRGSIFKLLNIKMPLITRES